MAVKKKSILPPFEVIIIVVFFLSFVLWAIKQCSSTKVELEEENAELPDEEATTGARIDTVTTTSVPLNAEAIDQMPKPTLPITDPTIAKPVESPKSILYVTIDGSKLRKSPSLKSEIILELKLFEELGYMNEYTDSTTQITLGYEFGNEVVDEPWIKVKHRGGRVGWVYGAGVDFRRKARPKVIE